MNGKEQIQINTSVDRLNFSLHGVAYVATAACVVSYVDSTIMTVAAVTASLGMSLYRRKIERWLYESLPATKKENLPHGSKTLPEVIARFSRRLDIRNEPPLYAVDAAPIQF